VNVIQHLLGRRIGLGETLHVVDKLATVHEFSKPSLQPESGGAPEASLHALWGNAGLI
jgi:hypothetical protein